MLIRLLVLTFYSVFVVLDCVVFAAKYLQEESQVIILDRYYYDSLIGFTDILTRYHFRILDALINHPDSIFLVDVPESKAMERKGEVTIGDAQRRRAAYLRLVQKLDVKDLLVLDGDKPIAENVHALVAHLSMTFPILAAPSAEPA